MTEPKPPVPASPVPPAGPPSSAVATADEATEIWEPPPPPPKKRRPVGLFDRIRILLIMVAWFSFSLWRLRDEQPAYTFVDAVLELMARQWWLLALAGIEVVRQVHYLISERNARYNTYWVNKVWGRIDAWKDRRDPWLRFRMARYTRWGVAYLILALVISNRRGTSVLDGIVALPGAVYGFLTTGPEQMPFWINILFPMFFIVGQFGLLFWFLSRGGVDVYMPEDVTTSFDDVWGQDQVLEKVQENMIFLENPESVEERGGHVPGGILLWGPPGTGKTLMAEAVAGQTGKPYVFVDPGAFINMFMGVGILKVKGLFRKLRKLSMKYGGVIVFFDEADSLGNRGALAQGGFGGGAGSSIIEHEHFRWLSPNTQAQLFREDMERRATPEPKPSWLQRRGIIVGGGMGGGGGMGTLQALLTEISGLKKPRGFINRFVRRFVGLKPKPPIKYRILIMMATNMPSALDGALLRPGRLDRIYKVGYPSKEGRKKTYEGYLRKVRHVLTDEQIEKLSVITPYATGATIKDLVNEALINAIRDDRDAVTWNDIIKAKHFKRLGPSEDVEYIERERHAIAVHEACHAIAFYRVRKSLHIDLATIEKGGTYLGFVQPVSLEDQFIQWKTDYESDIVVSLASLAGERAFFDDDNTSGVAGDLEHATLVAARMEGFWGMGQTVSSHAISSLLQLGGGGSGPQPGGDDDDRPERDPLAGPLGLRIEANLGRLLERTEQLIRDNWFEILAVAHALETHKTLAGEDVIAVIEGTEGPIVDGRAYHTQEARDELSAYHELAAIARRRHGRVDASLPTISLRASSDGVEAEELEPAKAHEEQPRP